MKERIIKKEFKIFTDSESKLIEQINRKTMENDCLRDLLNRYTERSNKLVYMIKAYKKQIQELKEEKDRILEKFEILKERLH